MSLNKTFRFFFSKNNALISKISIFHAFSSQKWCFQTKMAFFKQKNIFFKAVLDTIIKNAIRT